MRESQWEAQKRADSVAKDVAKEEAKKQAEGVARDEAKSKAEEVAKEVAKRKAEEVAKEEAKIVAKEKADSVSRRIAWETTKFYLATEGADLINNLAKNNLQKDAIEVVKAKVLDDLNRIIEERMNLYLPSKQLADLEKRIDDLESSLKPEIDKAVKEAILALLEKYKKA